jgi:hypothetical protein
MVSNTPQSVTTDVTPIGNGVEKIIGGSAKKDQIKIDAPNGTKAKVASGEVAKVENGEMKVISNAIKPSVLGEDILTSRLGGKPGQSLASIVASDPTKFDAAFDAQEKLKAGVAATGAGIVKDNKAANSLWGKIKNGFTADNISDASSIAAPIVGSLAALNAVKKMNAGPPPTLATNTPMNTRVNVNPQIAASRRAVAAGIDENNGNTISSAARVARNNRMLNDGAEREAAIYGQKENAEGQLRNQEAALRQRNNMTNSYMSSQYGERVAGIENQKAILNSQAINAGVSSIAAAGRDFQNRRDFKAYQDKALGAQIAGDTSNSQYKLIETGGITSQTAIETAYKSATTDAQRRIALAAMSDATKKKLGIK